MTHPHGVSTDTLGHVVINTPTDVIIWQTIVWFHMLNTFRFTGAKVAQRIHSHIAVRLKYSF